MKIRRLRLLACVPAVTLLAAAGTATAGNSRPAHLDPKHLDIVAEMADAGAILPGNDVRVDGVLAGRVRKIELAGGKARLTLRLSGAFTPVHADATVAVRPVSLLGERFVDLDRGSPSSPALPDGGLIPASQTRRSVDLDEVLSAVDDPTGDGLRALITGLGAGLAGRGDDAAKAIAALAPALSDTAGLLRILSDQNTVLQALIDRSSPVVAALGAERGRRLDELVANTKGLLDTTAASAPALGASLERLPGALATARAAFVALAALAGDTAPLLASLRPLTGDLASFAADLSAFAGAAGPALASLDPVLVKGRELIDAARPVVAGLAASGGDLRATASAGRRLVAPLPADLGPLFDFIRNFALATAGSDGISHYLRVLGTLNQEDGDGRSPVPVPQAPIISQPDSARTSPRPAPAAAISPAPLPVGGSATGLSAEQERALLTYLTGGGS